MRRKRTWVSKYGRASKGAFEYADGREHEARTYFHERHLWRPIGLQRVFFDYLPKKNDVTIHGFSSRKTSCLT